MSPAKPLERDAASYRVVVTGGPGSGKTTLVEALAARGYATVPEAGIQVIEELNRELGLEGQKAWRHARRSAFQVRVARRQAELEDAVPPDAGVVFLDRGLLDGLAYCRHFGEAVPPEVERLARGRRYDRVLLLDTLPAEAFAGRGRTGRTSDRDASLAIAAAIEAVYRERGYRVTRLPVRPVGERLELAVEAVLRAPGGPDAPAGTALP